MKKISKNKYLLGGLSITPFNQTDTFRQLTLPSIDALNALKNQVLKGVDASNTIDIGNILSSVGLIGGAAVTSFLGSLLTASSSGEAVAKSISSTLSGAMQGMQAGGPIGAAVGALAGSIGSKGNVTSNGFGQDPAMELGTGLVGAFTNKATRKRYNKIKDAAKSNRMGMINSSNAMLNWYEDYDSDINTMATGGIVPSNLAYVDDGETINTPQGDILEVPEKHQPVDSNLVNIPDGSKILSNTLKVPGTKKTYAQMYKDLSSKRKSKGNDIFAQNSARLNLLNDQRLHDELFDLQESRKKGRKESKYGILEFQIGGYSYNGKQYQEGDTVTINRVPYRVRKNKLFGYPLTIERINPKTTEISEPLTIYYPDESNKIRDYGVLPEVTVEALDLSSRPRTKVVKPRRTGRLIANDLGITFSPNIDPVEQFIEHPSINITQGDINRIVHDTTRLNIDDATTSTTLVKDDNVKSERNNNTNTSFPYLNLGNFALELAPVFSNLLDKPESFSAQLNPYRDLILTTMLNRRYNINPALKEIQRTRDITNYNASQLSPNTGASMAFRLQNAINTNDAISNLYSQKDNIDNRYLADYANMLNNLGQQYTLALNMATDLNARSRATSRNIRRAGLSQLSNYLQTNEQMRNQRAMDMAMLDLYTPFMQQGYTTRDWSNFIRRFQ